MKEVSNTPQTFLPPLSPITEKTNTHPRGERTKL